MYTCVMATTKPGRSESISFYEAVICIEHNRDYYRNYFRRNRDYPYAQNRGTYISTLQLDKNKNMTSLLVVVAVLLLVVVVVYIHILFFKEWLFQ